MRRHFCQSLVPLLCSLFLCSATAFAADFKAGAASREITPGEPVPMWGYGGRRAALSQGIFDALFAKALVIQAGETKLAIVALDLGRSPSEASLEIIRRRIKEEAGIDHSFIAGSHTHHGPVLELSDRPGRGKGKFEAALRYYKKLEDNIVAAIVEADRAAKPAKIAVGSVQLDGFNRNRHSKLARHADSELAVLRLDGADGKPIAVLANFAAHPTIVSAAGLRFSADFVGSLRAVAEEKLGAPVLFMQGAAGDLSSDQSGRKGHEAYGAALGEEVAKLAGALEPAEVLGPTLKVTEERFQFASRINLNDPAVRVMYSLAFFPELVNNFFDEYADGIRPRLTVAMLNDEIALVGASGEFFAGHSLHLKRRARVKQVFFFGYCNGYHQYFPTIEAVAEGGYGADRTVAPAEIGAGEQMMDAALMRIYQLKGDLRELDLKR